ncbi:MAG: ATP-grasp domain-containing protein, partial [Dehalococcoidia bacterium]
AINLAGPLHVANRPILGSSAEAIDVAEDRSRFEGFLAGLGIPQPPGAGVTNIEDALATAQRIEYPVLVRPSYVLGGRAMEIVQNASELVQFVAVAEEANPGKPILIDKYIEGREVEVDAICDGEAVLIPGVMEHIERAGVHSGDSMAVYPPINLSEQELATVVDYTQRIGLALHVRGLMNVQYVIIRGDEGSEVFVLEVNPRSSRTVPFLSKVTGVPMVRLATLIMLGRSLRDQGYEGGLWPARHLVAVKAPAFSMSKLIGVDTYLGPEMKSTGEVMGVDRTFPAALAKAILSAELALPPGGAMLLSIADQHKPEAVPIVGQLVEAGFRLYATEGTAAMLATLGLPVEQVTKRLSEGHPNVVDVIRDGTVDGAINISEGRLTGTLRDGFHIRRAAAERRIPCFTSLDTARAAAGALLAGAQTFTIQPLKSYLE